jgi:RNA polymerase sigma-70 factor, ECF subfamily
VLVNEDLLITQLQEGDIQAYEIVYKNYFKRLLSYAFTILQSEEKAEEIVQNVFVKLWEKKESIDIQTSLKSYLYKSVYNGSLNELKKEKVAYKYEQYQTNVLETSRPSEPSAVMHYKELERKLKVAIDALPEQCRTVFQMSRFEDLKYREIANELNISPKTVEQHMSKALKELRIQLADFLFVLVGFVITLKSYLL